MSVLYEPDSNRGKAFLVKGVKINFVYKFEFTIFDNLQITVTILYNLKCIANTPKYI